MDASKDSVQEASQVIPATCRYLNIPISRAVDPLLFRIDAEGRDKLEFPIQLAEGAIDYWVFLDISEYAGHSITLSGPASPSSLARIYQSNEIEGQAELYHEADRPQFHFTTRRGWNNDVNGPIFCNGKYHLFWQAFVFGVKWDTGFMYWGHAVSHDLLHWTELPPALKNDKLGSPWSGTAVVDHNNSSGWGNNALVLFYTAFDRFTKKQVQCIAYSTDSGETFQRFEGNSVLDSNEDVGSVDTRDPKVFWYEPAKHWVMVLFEKSGMTFYTSLDLKSWAKKSHFPGLHECPDLFELPVDGDPKKKKWVLHGGSPSYFIGSFDGETFTPESGELRYVEGRTADGADLLYAAQSFENMPGSRRVQMAWGRIEPPGASFNQTILFPTEQRLATTRDSVRLLATPIREIELLHRKEHAWLSPLTAAEANDHLQALPDDALHITARLNLAQGDQLTLRYAGNLLATITHDDLADGRGQMEILIDKIVAEVFIDHGRRYIVCDITRQGDMRGLEFEHKGSGTVIEELVIHEMDTIWTQDR